MTTMSDDGRPLPLANPTTERFFEAARAGRLELQRCPRDGFFFYPRNRCPRCLGDDWEWQPVSGRGAVHACTVDRVGHVQALRGRAPFVIAVVELDEGPRLTANIVDCAPDDVRVGMPVEATFEDVDGTPIVQFRPV